MLSTLKNDATLSTPPTDSRLPTLPMLRMLPVLAIERMLPILPMLKMLPLLAIHRILLAPAANIAVAAHHAKSALPGDTRQNGAQRVADFAERHVVFDAFHEQRQQILTAARRRVQPSAQFGDFRVVAACAQRSQLVARRRLDRRIDAQDVRVRVLARP